MSRRAEALVGVVAMMTAMLAPAGAQTIGDYSHAQRSLIEDGIAQAAARAASQAPAQPTAASMPAAAVPAVRHPPPAPPEPALRVSGTFSTRSSTLAEIDVDGIPYLLAAGQAVPGTPWRVESAAADRITLERMAIGNAVSPRPARRSFVLPPLRRIEP